MNLTDIKLKLLKGFEALGTKNGTAVPEGATDNRFAIAYEMFVAYHISSMAEKRKDKAKKAALDAGILLDNYKPSSEVSIYVEDGLAIIAKTASPAQRLDPAILRGKLIREVGEKKAQEIIDFSTKESKPATSYIFV